MNRFTKSSTLARFYLKRPLLPALLLPLMAAGAWAANAPSFQWARNGASTNAGFFDPGAVAESLAVDGTGNSVAVGSFGAVSLTMGGVTVTNLGESELFVARHNSAGALTWLATIGGSGSQSGRDVALDSGGNVYVAGGFSGTTAVGGTTLNASGSQDGMLVKLNSAGQPVWFRRYGGNADDSAAAVFVAGDGSIYLAGQFQNSITLGPTTLNSSGNYDVFVAKLDANGTPLWATRIGGASFDVPGGITLDSAGNVLVAGMFTGSITLGGTTLDNGALEGLFVAKLDPNGNLLWGNGATTTAFSYFTDIQAGAGNSVYVCGRFRAKLTAGGTTLTSNGGFQEDAFVGKLDSAGAWVWAVQAGGAGIDYATQLGFLPDGNLAVSGYFTASTTTFATFGNYTLLGYGQADIYVAGLSTAGEWLWATRAGSALADVANAIGVDAAGGIYVAGHYDGPATFSDLSLNRDGVQDNAFVAKLGYSTALTIRDHPESVTTVAGRPLTLTVVVNGAEPVSYQWFKNDQIIQNATAGSLVFANLVTNDSGAYKVQVSNSTTVAFFSNPGLLKVYPQSQNATVLSAITLGGTGSEGTSRVATDADGNIYVAGYFGAAATIGSTPVGGQGAQDAVLVKYTPAGTVAWVWSAGGTGFDTVGNVIVDASGNVFISGNFTGSITIGGTPLNSSSPTTGDLFWAKLNSQGVVQWARGTVGGSVASYDLKPDGNGGIYVVGEVGFGAAASVQFGATTVSAVSGQRVGWVTHVTSNGAFDWTRTLAGTGAFVFPRSLAPRAGGGVWVGGMFNGTVDFGGQSRTAANDNDLFIAGITGTGSVASLETRDGGGNESLAAIGDAGGGALYVVATFSTGLTLGTTTLTNTDASVDLAIWKQTTDGSQTVSWSRQFVAVNGSLGINQVITDASANLIIIGSFNNLLAYDAGSVFTGGRFVADAFVLAMDPQGGVLRFAQSGVNLSSLFTGVALLPSGEVVSSGSFSANVTVGGQALTTAGQSDWVYFRLPALNQTPGPTVTISNPERLANGRFRFSVTGPAGANVTVERTENLNQSFGAPEVLPNPTGTVSYEDAGATGQPTRFYRVQVGAGN